jgi:hypothetical protein
VALLGLQRRLPFVQLFDVSKRSHDVVGRIVDVNRRGGNGATWAHEYRSRP